MPAAHRCLTLHWRSEFGIGRRPLASSTHSFVQWAILQTDVVSTKKIQFFLEKRIFLHVQTYNLYVKKKFGGGNVSRSRIAEKVGKPHFY